MISDVAAVYLEKFIKSFLSAAHRLAHAFAVNDLPILTKIKARARLLAPVITAGVLG